MWQIAIPIALGMASGYMRNRNEQAAAADRRDFNVDMYKSAFGTGRTPANDGYVGPGSTMGESTLAGGLKGLQMAKGLGMEMPWDKKKTVAEIDPTIAPTRVHFNTPAEYSPQMRDATVGGTTFAQQGRPVSPYYGMLG